MDICIYISDKWNLRSKNIWPEYKNRWKFDWIFNWHCSFGEFLFSVSFDSKDYPSNVFHSLSWCGISWKNHRFAIATAPEIASWHRSISAISQILNELFGVQRHASHTRFRYPCFEFDKFCKNVDENQTHSRNVSVSFIRIFWCVFVTKNVESF